MKARNLYLVEVALAVAAAVLFVILTGHWAEPGTPALWPWQR